MNTPHTNSLLERLPAHAKADLMRAATRVSLAREEEVIKQGQEIRRIVFPETAVCSCLINLRSGQRAEVSTVGNEGVVGIPRLLGRATSPEQVVAQIGGDALVVAARDLVRLQERHESLRKLLFEYAGYSLQVARQTSACNAYHRIDQRLARWLLVADDRANTEEFYMTHELLTHMVAATRPRVSEAAARLRDEGVIDYRTGRMLIVDRARLEAAACECYRVTRRALEALYGRR